MKEVMNVSQMDQTMKFNFPEDDNKAATRDVLNFIV